MDGHDGSSSFKGLSDAEIVERGHFMCESVRLQGIARQLWFDWLSWSDSFATRPQRRLLRTTLRDGGFLVERVEQFSSRRPNSNARFTLQLLHMYGEQLEDRLDLFRTPGFLKCLEFEITHPESPQYFDAVQIFWGLLEEQSLATKYAPMAKHFLPATNPEKFDCSHAIGE